MHFNWSSLIRYFSKDYETFITCDDEGWMWWVATRAVALVYGLYRIIMKLQLIVEKQWIAIFIINIVLSKKKTKYSSTKSKLCEKSSISRFLFKKKNSTFHAAWIAFVSHSILFKIFTINVNLWKKFILKCF